MAQARTQRNLIFLGAVLWEHHLLIQETRMLSILQIFSKHIKLIDISDFSSKTMANAGGSKNATLTKPGGAAYAPSK